MYINSASPLEKQILILIKTQPDSGVLAINWTQHNPAHEMDRLVSIYIYTISNYILYTFNTIMGAELILWTIKLNGII